MESCKERGPAERNIVQLERKSDSWKKRLTAAKKKQREGRLNSWKESWAAGRKDVS
jgi:hypothetical protein